MSVSQFDYIGPLQVHYKSNSDDYTGYGVNGYTVQKMQIGLLPRLSDGPQYRSVFGMSLVDGFTYYMDERNNQDAHGEGTSSQAARTGGSHPRNARSKGKDVEATTPSHHANEFEPVMCLCEKVTHDNTLFLHVVSIFRLMVQIFIEKFFRQGTNPQFSDYQDFFSDQLPTSLFATYIRPANLPDPPSLLRMARAVYPYWKERRTERDCHRVIPALNVSIHCLCGEQF